MFKVIVNKESSIDGYEQLASNMYTYYTQVTTDVFAVLDFLISTYNFEAAVVPNTSQHYMASFSNIREL